MRPYRKSFLMTLLVAIGLAMGASLSTRPAVAQEVLLGQIIMVATNYCPSGMVEADGRILPIASNMALFSLLGTTYGGNGTTTFAVPDLRGVITSAGSGASIRFCIATVGVYPERN
jgi:microcystin-dependent protein